MIACCSDRTVAALLRTLPDYRDWTESAGTTRGVCLEGSGKYRRERLFPSGSTPGASTIVVERHHGFKAGMAFDVSTLTFRRRRTQLASPNRARLH